MNAQPRAAAPGFSYRLLALLLYPLWRMHALLHGRKHELDSYASLRCANGAADSQARIWVHAASVGEVRAVTPLVKALLARGDEVLFTSFTATGYKAIQSEFGERLASTVIPIDCRSHCRRFFQLHRVRLGLVMETELWPELLYQARRQGIELLLINARLSAKSLDANRLVRRWLARTLGYFNRILTRNAADREALLSLGASAGRIEILGNLKARRTVAASPTPTPIVNARYLLLASSHDGEERRLLAARPAALRDTLLVIAPRHPARSESIRAEIDKLGLSCAVRSLEQPLQAETEVYLADTLGELPSLMAHAAVVIMGGSFDTTGGHNLIEPASLGCAIITGPSDTNIAADIEMLGNGVGLLQVESIDACWQALLELLQHPERARALGREAQARLARQPDILQRYLDSISVHL